MSFLSVSPLTHANLDRVVEIEAKSGDVGWTREHFEKELGEPIARFFVLEEGFNILGYGGYWKVSDEAQITNFVINPEARGQGKGRYLLQYLLEDAQAAGCRAMTLEVRSANPAARQLYQTEGFSEQARRPKAYSNPTDDAILMVKKL